MLMQRFKAVEASSKDVPFPIANQMELVESEDRVSAAGQREIELAQKACMRDVKLRNAIQSRAPEGRGAYGGGWAAGRHR